MLQYLQIQCSRYQLLVEACGVLEVLDFSTEPQEGEASHGCRLWRGTSLQVINLQTVLADESATSQRPQAAVVYGASGSEIPVLLLCDRVIGLKQADEAAFNPLPCSEARLNRYIDKVLPDVNSGRILLRLALSGENIHQPLSDGVETVAIEGAEPR